MSTKTKLIQLHNVTDATLVAGLHRSIGNSRDALVKMLLYLGEVDSRKLYLEQAKSSMFTFCTDVLEFSCSSAGRRIAAARAIRKYPQIAEHLAGGRLHLCAVATLAKHLTADNHAALLAEAANLSKMQLSELIATINPLPCVADRVRRMPRRSTEDTQLDLGDRPRSPVRHAPPPKLQAPLAPAKPATIKPLGEQRYSLGFTADRQLVDKLERVKALLSHRIRGADLAAIFGLALDSLRETLEKERFRKCQRSSRAVVDSHSPVGVGSSPTLKTTLPKSNAIIADRRPNTSSRYISKAVRDTVWSRDAGSCAFVSADNKRCGETHFVQFHHRQPFARGGAAIADNIQLLCGPHNRYLVVQDFGADLISRKMADGQQRQRGSAIELKLTG